MTQESSDKKKGNVAMELGLIAATAVLTFSVVGSGVFEPEELPGFNTAQLSQYYADVTRFARMQQECYE